MVLGENGGQHWELKMNLTPSLPMRFYSQNEKSLIRR